MKSSSAEVERPAEGSLSPQEIQALARMLDRLDYYRLLRVERGAQISEIRAAYHRARRSFHPDSFLSADPELRGSVDRIAKRITESYLVLRDPKRRSAYDRTLERGQVRFTAESEATEREAEQARGGTTPNGKRFYRMAVDEERRGDRVRARAHMKMALTFEPENEHFQAKFASLQQTGRAR